MKLFDESSPADRPQPWWEELAELYFNAVGNFQKPKFAPSKSEISSWNDRCWVIEGILQLIPTKWYFSLCCHFFGEGSCQHQGIKKKDHSIQQSFSRNQNSKCLESFGFHLLGSQVGHPRPSTQKNLQIQRVLTYTDHPWKIGETMHEWNI